MHNTLLTDENLLGKRGVTCDVEILFGGSDVSDALGMDYDCPHLAATLSILLRIFPLSLSFIPPPCPRLEAADTLTHCLFPSFHPFISLCISN